MSFLPPYAPTGIPAPMIFDEVITGFRLQLDGAVGFYHVQPDLVTYGKIIGAGMPVGAYGGRKDIMQLVAPLGSVYQAGTLSGNPTAPSSCNRNPEMTSSKISNAPY